LTSGRKTGNPRGAAGRGRTGRLRPGQVVACAARSARRDWWRILGAAIPVSLAAAGLEIVADHYGDPSDSLLSLTATLSSTGIALGGAVLLSGFICRLIGAAEHRMEPLTFPQLARSLPWWRLIAADIVVTLAVAGGLLLFVVPGLIAMTFLAVVGPVIEIERQGVAGAARRSAQLTRRHFWTTALLATAPLAASGELEAIAPEPHQAGQIAAFLIVRGLAEGIVEACIAVILVELCFQLIDAEASAARAAGQPPA
jgi:hypothetical protein